MFGQAGGGNEVEATRYIFQQINRLGHGDFGRAMKPGLLFCIDFLTIAAGGERNLIENAVGILKPRKKLLVKRERMHQYDK